MKRTSRAAPALEVLSGGQIMVLAVVVVMLALAALVQPVVTIVVVNSGFAAFFVAANVMKLLLIRRSMDRGAAVGLQDASPVPDDQLPVYTILLPLYHEAAVLEQLMTG
ncbi:MAG: hypothetical protein J2P57_18950, partial [Acidimicrobiaceae bacterium]|nr:hypothetical protein [Acidimicrobiaceae bacterium]